MYTNKCGIFIDVGANFGEFTAGALDLADTVLCFEPNHALASLLTQNFSASENVQVIESAVSDAPSSGHLYLREGYSGGSSLAPEYLRSLKGRTRPSMKRRLITTPTKITTIDIAVAEVSSASIPEPGTGIFLKIDVEGFDLEAFNGSSGLRDAAPFWFCLIEFSPRCLHALGKDASTVWGVLQSYPGVIVDEASAAARLLADPRLTLPKTPPQDSCDILIRSSP